MDRLGAYKIFSSVAESGGYSAAAKALGISKSAASRQVAALEGEVGAQLLRRSTRSVKLTDTGYAYLERVRAILEDIAEADRAASAHQDTASGLLRINAPMSFGMSHLAPATFDFMTKFPEIEVSLMLNDRFVDPYEEGFDLTVRIGELTASSLLARKLAQIDMGLYASPAYLARAGRPLAPADLAAHVLLHYGHTRNGAEWALGGAKPLHVQPILCSNSGEVLREAAVAGKGITLLPCFIVRREIESGALVQLLDGFEPKPLPLNAVYPPTRFLAAKVRLYIDFLAERFRRQRP